jgi:hypothetical protein
VIPLVCPALPLIVSLGLRHPGRHPRQREHSAIRHRRPPTGSEAITAALTAVAAKGLLMHALGAQEPGPATPRCCVVGSTRRVRRTPPAPVTPASTPSDTAADSVVLTADQQQRLNDLTPATGARHHEANMASIDR